MFFAAKTQIFDSKLYCFRGFQSSFRTVLERFNLKLVDLFTFSAGRRRPLLQETLENIDGNENQEFFNLCANC